MTTQSESVKHSEIFRDMNLKWYSCKCILPTNKHYLEWQGYVCEIWQWCVLRIIPKMKVNTLWRCWISWYSLLIYVGHKDDHSVVVECRKLNKSWLFETRWSTWPLHFYLTTLNKNMNYATTLYIQQQKHLALHIVHGTSPSPHVKRTVRSPLR